MASKEMISHVEAINNVGKVLFAEDWIGEMLLRDKEVIFPSIAAEERTLIEEYGPRPAVRGGITIKPCLSGLQAKLERALGRQQLIPAQRGAAADWLLEHGLAHAGGCDPTAIAVALAGLGENAGQPGAVAKKPTAVERDPTRPTSDTSSTIPPTGFMARKDAVRDLIGRGIIPANTTNWDAFCGQVRDLANGWIDKKKGTCKHGFSDKMISRDVKEIINTSRMSEMSGRMSEMSVMS